ncbi:hypothetical protein RKD31_001916 [Streptomyces sp. SAI-163]
MPGASTWLSSPMPIPETSSPSGPGSGRREATWGQHPCRQQVREDPPGAHRPEHRRIPGQHQPGPVRQRLREQRARLDVELRRVEHDQQVEVQRPVGVPPRSLGAGQQPGHGDHGGSGGF